MQNINGCIRSASNIPSHNFSFYKLVGKLFYFRVTIVGYLSKAQVRCEGDLSCYQTYRYFRHLVDIFFPHACLCLALKR